MEQLHDWCLINCTRSILSEMFIQLSSKREYGTIQGSILGPLLFILYINDMPLHLDHCLSQMYADDTTLYQFSNSFTRLEYVFNRDLLNLSSWCITNKLVTNAKKTHTLVICNHQKRRLLPMQSFHLNVDSIEIDCVDSVKMLGVTIDNNLTMASHIDTICTKISKLSGLLWRVNLLRKIVFYNLYIQPCFDYCSIAAIHT